MLAEFFDQGDVERARGLPVSPLCDRSQANVPSAQLGFIEFCVEPVFKPLSKFFAIQQRRKEVGAQPTAGTPVDSGEGGANGEGAGSTINGSGGASAGGNGGSGSNGSGSTSSISGNNLSGESGSSSSEGGSGGSSGGGRDEGGHNNGNGGSGGNGGGSGGDGGDGEGSNGDGDDKDDGTAAKDKGACDDYKLDMAGTRFGVCKCGFSKVLIRT